MGFHTKSADDVHTVWNHTFKWTDKHFTPEDLMPLRQQADDLAADSVTKLQAITAKEKEDNPNAPPGRVDMYGVLEKRHAEDEVLQKIWDEVNTVPDWVDWAQIERGQQFLYRYLVPNLTGLALQGFLGGTATIAGGTEVLVRTGGFSIRVLPRRFLETFLWLLQVTISLRSIQPGGEGHISTVRVRLLHSTVRNRILKLIEKDPAYFDVEELGTPVNLRDAIHATSIFCCMPLFRQLPKIGIQPQPEETKDFLALFRYIAYVMATPDSYFDGPEQCKATMESIMLCEPEPTEASKAIGMNFVSAVQDYPGVNVSRPMIETGCRVLSGDELADKMGFPRANFVYFAAFKGWCTLLVVLTTLQQWIPAFDRLVINKSKDFVMANIFEASLLKGEGRFELRYIPQLNQYTKKEEVSVKSSLFRPIETIGLVVFALKYLTYLIVFGALVKVALMNGRGILPVF